MKPDSKTLKDRLDTMVEKGINSFDPVRFTYIESLVRRAARMPEAVREQLEQRAVTALADYESCFKRAQKEAEKLMEHTASAYPEATRPLQRLYSANDFKGIQRMVRRLQGSPSRSPLGLLLEQISGENRLAFQEASLIDGLSHRHEDEMPDETAKPAGGNTDALPGSEVSDLKSYQLFRETWARHYSDKLVSDAVLKLPKDPGPLNSQLLITRSLIMMRSLSPNYLKRFVSYVDTLLWLEEATK